jgi:hypothetical protein
MPGYSSRPCSWQVPRIPVRWPFQLLPAVKTFGLPRRTLTSNPCSRVSEEGHRANQIAPHTLLLATTAAALAIAAAPSASAAPGEQPCSDAGGSTDCQRPSHAQVYTAPRALPRVLPPSINPRWTGLGYSARFPKYGFDPKWQAFGYNPKYSGFQPRPSVLRAPEPRNPDATDRGGSTTHQTTGNVQITAQIGLAAQQADPPQYPSLASTRTDAGGATIYQRPGHAQITAQPGPAAKNAAHQSAFFAVSDLPTA